MTEKKLTIGIDLGTSKCCVGVVRNGRVEILENESGTKTTPSYVAFTDTERLVGQNAMDQARSNPTNTLNGMKRIIGREFEDPLVTEYCKNVPFAVIAKENGICVRASYRGREEFLYPQQITASLLQKMKSMVEAAFQCTVEQAVISVPASFENSQRQATKEAAAIAGLEVLALINEPTAAALTYQQNKSTEEREVIAVIDFGGGKLDVSIVAVSKSEVEVLSVSGSQEIGGEYLVDLIMELVMKAIMAKFGEGFIPNRNLLVKLRVGSEKAKKTLTLLPQSSIHIDCVKGDEDFHIDISRGHFNRIITSKLHPVLIRCLDKTFQASGLNKNEVSLALLVGGSSRIPLFKEWLKKYLDPIPIAQTVNLDEAIASGAALYAALLRGNYDIPVINIKDILSNTFCMFREVDPNMQYLFFSPKVTIPSDHVMPYCKQSPFNDETKHETVELFEEISDRNIHHKLIGTLCLYDEFSRATSLIKDVFFSIDRCGVFDVDVILSTTPQTTFSSIVKDYTGKLRIEEFSRAVRKEEMFQRDERLELKRVETCAAFEKLCLEIVSKVKCPLYKDEFPELVESLSVCAAEGLDWVEDMLLSTEEVLQRLEPLEALYEEFTVKIENLEKETLERTAEVAELSSLCSDIDVLLRTHGDWSDHSQISFDMRSEVEQITQWLQLTETPSQIDCEKKKITLKNMFEKSVSSLVDNRQIIKLRNYCLDLRETLPNNVDYEHCPEERESLICEVDDCLGWLDSTKRTFTAECVKRMSSLKNKHRQLVELEGFNSETQEQTVDDPALLRRICLQTRDLVKKCVNICEMDPQKIKCTKKQIMDFLCLVDDGDKVPKEEWKEKISEVLVSKVMFESTLRKHEQTRLNEEERLATLRELKKSISAMQGRMVNVLKRKTCRLAMQVADELVKWLETTNMFSKEAFEKRAEELETFNERINEKIDRKAKEDLAAKLAKN